MYYGTLRHGAGCDFVFVGKAGLLRCVLLVLCVGGRNAGSRMSSPGACVVVVSKGVTAGGRVFFFRPGVWCLYT